MSTTTELLDPPMLLPSELESEFSNLPPSLMSSFSEVPEGFFPEKVDVQPYNGGLKVLLQFASDVADSLGWVRLYLLRVLVCRILDRRDPHHRQVVVMVA